MGVICTYRLNEIRYVKEFNEAGDGSRAVSTDQGVVWPVGISGLASSPSLFLVLKEPPKKKKKKKKKKKNLIPFVQLLSFCCREVSWVWAKKSEMCRTGVFAGYWQGCRALGTGLRVRLQGHLWSVSLVSQAAVGSPKILGAHNRR